MIRLYGPQVGYSSFAVVTKGFKLALEHHAKLAGYMPTDTAFDEHKTYPGAEAFAAVMCGHPMVIDWLSRRGLHEYRAFMIAPNSSWVPPTIMASSGLHCSEILTPSKWGAEVIRNNPPPEQFPTIPVRVVPHGILPGYEPGPEPSGKFTILHLASPGIDRKGTMVLVQAFLGWGRRPDARLRLVLSEMTAPIVRMHIEQLAGKVPIDIEIVSRVNAAPETLRGVYQQAHLLCQPSRCEGFGICPIESKACGIPVAVTNCTGHTEWIDGSEVLIEHGPDAYTDDGPQWAEPMAPTVEPESVMKALDVGYDRYHELRASALSNAQRIAEQWSWPAKLADWISHLKELKNAADRSV